MTPIRTLLVRVDESSAIGSGHIMRCLAIAQAWQERGGDVVFAVSEAASATRKRLRREGVVLAPIHSEAGSLADAQESAMLASARSVEWVVADGIQFGPAYQSDVKNRGLRLLYLDDTGQLSHYWADIVLNSSLAAEDRLYLDREPYTKLLLGPRFLLLRREFLEASRRRKTSGIALKLLVSMGGSDPENVSIKVLEALHTTVWPSLEVIVTVGPNYPHLNLLEQAARSCVFSVELRQGADMPALMDWADMCVSAEGSTAWELLFVGVPTLVICTNLRQRMIAAALEAAGAVQNLGWHEDLTAERLGRAIYELATSHEIRLRLIQCGHKLVDGCGAGRVCDFLLSEDEWSTSKVRTAL